MDVVFRTARARNTRVEATSNRPAQVFALGGNDQADRRDVAQFNHAGELLERVLVPSAVARVVLAGHPEGHPGLGRSPSLTAAALEAKAAAALAAGLDVTVASQFCLDAAKLVAWLAATREQLRTCAAAAAAAEARADASRPPRVDFRVGVAGPVGGCVEFNHWFGWS